MKTRALNTTMFLLFMVLLAGCGKTSVAESTSTEQVSMLEEEPPVNIVEVTTTGMNFILPKEVPSGWTTFRYTNKSTWTHFMLIDRMPVHEGKQITFEDFTTGVPPVFNDAYALIREGNTEEGFAEFERLPVWFGDIIFYGGIGLVSPGESAESTLYIEPGTYVVECYVKTDGEFHPMRESMIVKDMGNTAEEPEADVSLEISEEGGINILNKLVPGEQIIGVEFIDQTSYSHFLGHDVHLVKYEEGEEIAEINSWMNWIDITGLETPSPGKWIGGTQDMPAGKKGYFKVNLKPGKYAFVAEVPDPLSKNMLKVFEIEEDADFGTGN
ncbi:hypothetical protein OO013_19310 [Mangrovivirga sp. M17]|uniref:Uncharacterized protein n=1 Tax=Mangrovivirga halotolerans TaxID=2993936 RepID=A0ABT3RWS8_9BACT|nr:hypothetical protein [Mangrovivirga halotolerans]MCX2746037.1 hypothetical protein [Mangrovivirga halotolerans]